MKRRIQLFAILLLIVAVSFVLLKTHKEFDIVIKGGTIIDGTGNPASVQDVGIINDRIAFIGKISKSGKMAINAKGLTIAPGFIDVHTHVDEKILSEPTVKNYLLQGVTSVVGGNCGTSQYPVKDLFSQLKATGFALNFTTYVGHNTIRDLVMGQSSSKPRENELAKMKILVHQEMQSGAIGLSTGLDYSPGQYSTTEEIIELAKMIHPFNGIYATHLRDQGTGIRKAIEEAIRIGREAKVTVEISHIKLADEAVWGKYELITGPIEAAQQQGMKVYMDQYPYTATSTGFANSLPGWALVGGHDSLLIRLTDPGLYKKIKNAIIKKRLTSLKGIDKLKTIYISYNENHQEYEGKNLAEILSMLGRERTVSNGADLIIEMEKCDHPKAIFFRMAENDVAELMSKPYTLIISDGKIEFPGVEKPHPRAYGTFPRVLSKYVREKKILTLPEAIQKMTSLPASVMGFEKRGFLIKGYYADIVIFDFDRIDDTSTFANPHQYPKGIHTVIVNGKIAAQNGKLLDVKSGRILSRR